MTSRAVEMERSPPPPKPAPKYNLPTGAELMSTPIVELAAPGKKDKVLTRFEKEKAFIMHNVARRLDLLVPERAFQLRKSVCFWVGILFAVIGTVLVLKGFQATPLFQAYNFNIIEISIGGVLCLPLCGWFLYVYALPIVPSVRRRRAELHMQRKERKNPGLFNDMVRQAEENSQPPVKKIRIYLNFRKHEFNVTAHTVQEMCEQIEYRTNLRPSQQLFKYKGEELHLPLDKVLEDLQIREGTKFDLYNRGGYVVDVKTSPEHRLQLPHEGDDPDDTESIMEKSLVHFRRDPMAYHKMLEIDDSDSQMSSLGKDNSTVMSLHKGPPSMQPQEYRKPSQGGVRKYNEPEEAKQSGFADFLVKSSKKIVPVDNADDDVSEITMHA